MFEGAIRMNLITPQSFLIIVDKNCPDLNSELNLRLKTWLIESAHNKDALKKIPPPELRDIEERLTLFSADSSVNSEQHLIEVLSQIDERNWTTIKVIGVAPTFLVSDVLKSTYRIVHIEPLSNGFIATRAVE
jgi:hypothetical protein